MGGAKGGEDEEKRRKVPKIRRSRIKSSIYKGEVSMKLAGGLDPKCPGLHPAGGELFGKQLAMFRFL